MLVTVICCQCTRHTGRGPEPRTGIVGFADFFCDFIHNDTCQETVGPGLGCVYDDGIHIVLATHRQSQKQHDVKTRTHHGAQHGQYVVFAAGSKHLVVRVPVLGPASGPGTKSPQPKPNCEASPLRSSFRAQKMDPESGPQRVRKTGVPVRGCLRKRWILLSGKCPFVSRGLGITVGRAVGRPLDFA